MKSESTVSQWRWYRRLVPVLLLSLTLFMSLRFPHITFNSAGHTFRSQSDPGKQREMQRPDLLEIAETTSSFVVNPSSSYQRQPINAHRALSPRRLPGAYYNRPPPLS